MTLTDTEFANKLGTLAYVRMAVNELDPMAHDRMAEAGLSKDRYEDWRGHSVAYLILYRLEKQLEHTLSIPADEPPRHAHDTNQFVDKALTLVEGYYKEALQAQDIMLASTWDTARKAIKSTKEGLETINV